MRYQIQTKGYRGILFDKWLLKLEKAAFGWNHLSTTDEYSHTSTHVDLDAGTATTTNHYITVMTFYRVKPYSANILFMLLELLSSIVSAIRRFFMVFLGPLVILVGIMFILNFTVCDDPSGLEMLKQGALGIAVGYGACLFAPSFILLGLGYLVRFVFRIDDKLRQNLRDNGYSDDLTEYD